MTETIDEFDFTVDGKAHHASTYYDEFFEELDEYDEGFNLKVVDVKNGTIIGHPEFTTLWSLLEEVSEELPREKLHEFFDQLTEFYDDCEDFEDFVHTYLDEDVNLKSIRNIELTQLMETIFEDTDLDGTPGFYDLFKPDMSIRRVVPIRIDRDRLDLNPGIDYYGFAYIAMDSSSDIPEGVFDKFFAQQIDYFKDYVEGNIYGITVDGESYGGYFGDYDKTEMAADALGVSSRDIKIIE